MLMYAKFRVGRPQTSNQRKPDLRRHELMQSDICGTATTQHLTVIQIAGFSPGLPLLL